MKAVEVMPTAVRRKSIVKSTATVYGWILPSESQKGITAGMYFLRHSLFYADIDTILALSVSSFPLPCGSFL